MGRLETAGFFMQENNMNQHILKKPALDMGAWEIEIAHRLKRGKNRLLIVHALFFILTVSIVFFVL